MSAYQLASRNMSQQAAAELAIDEGDAPFHKSRPIPRMTLGEDEEAVLAAAGPVRPRELSTSLYAQTPLSATAIAPISAPVSATEKEASWHEVRRSNSPTSHSNLSYHSPLHSPHSGSGKGLQARSSHSHAVGGSFSSSQRHLERMAQPRNPKGAPIVPSQPNYGQVLSFTEEEEQDRLRAAQRLQRAKSPRTPRTSFTSCLADKPQSIPTTTILHTSPMEKTPSAAAVIAPPKPRPLSAAQQARLEKLAVPKKHPSPLEAEPERVPRPRSTTTNGDSTGSSSDVFDRLSISKKQTSSPLSEGRQSHASLTPASQPGTNYSATHTPVSTQSTQSQGAVFQRLAQPKSKPQTHKDVNGMVEYNPYSPVKRYYGGTTTISVPPASSSAAGDDRSPTSHAAGWGKPRTPKVSWDMVDRSALIRSQPTLHVPEEHVCAECGHTLQQQTADVVAQPTSGPSNKGSAAQPLPPRPVVAARPVAVTTAANSSTIQIGTSTVVQSAPAKPSGTKPPIVIRTRRYVPTTEEEAAVVTEDAGKAVEETPQKAAEPAVAAPQPVQATRRRTAPVSLLPANPPPVIAAAPAVASVKPPSTAHPAPALAASVEVSLKCLTPAAAPPPSHPPVAASVRAVKPVPVVAEEPTTRASVQASRRRSSSSTTGALDDTSHNSAAPAPTQAAIATRCAASNVAEAPTPTPTPTHGVVQAVERNPRRPLSSPVLAAAPEATTETLKPVLPAALVSPPLPPSSPYTAQSPPEAEAGDGHKEEGGLGEAELPGPVASKVPKPTTSPKPRAGESVYDRLAPPPIPLNRLKTHSHLHKKRCIRIPKPEILTDEDFACQLEEFSPELRQPVVIRQKPKAEQKKEASEKRR
ncbi:hypothetical protein ABL78_7447 [Leptomonas seymouri]|uniref:Uncharacterized protein n=1 Tax=Leptomonas seymouri TaxID=5684 RepID=A0A0N1I0L3_LEPSE|nr:hypothetical protein ABL78_7447 [Leptomonas seymouri]|eukprot:KPI83515.1 hypothetical protein ABL78_7447 [Leptomonas seymouri]